jgi:putative transposase
MQGWCSRPLQGVYAAIFIDAIYVKVRDGQVGNQPFYAAIGVDLGGRRDVLGLWAGKGGGESAKFWMNVLADLKNRGVRDVFFVVCDGLKGLPDSVNAVFPQAIVQACVIHLIRATLRYASRKYWDQLAKDLRRDLHRTHRRGGMGGVRGAGGEMGQALPGHPQDVESGVGGVHPLPGLRRGDPPGAVLHQRHRYLEPSSGCR